MDTCTAKCGMPTILAYWSGEDTRARRVFRSLSSTHRWYEIGCLDGPGVRRQDTQLVGARVTGPNLPRTFERQLAASAVTSCLHAASASTFDDATSRGLLDTSTAPGIESFDDCLLPIAFVEDIDRHGMVSPSLAEPLVLAQVCYAAFDFEGCGKESKRKGNGGWADAKEEASEDRDGVADLEKRVKIANRLQRKGLRPVSGLATIDKPRRLRRCIGRTAVVRSRIRSSADRCGQAPREHKYMWCRFRPRCLHAGCRRTAARGYTVLLLAEAQRDDICAML